MSRQSGTSAVQTGVDVVTCVFSITVPTPVDAALEPLQALGQLVELGNKFLLGALSRRR